MQQEYLEQLDKMIERLYPDRWRIKEFLMFDLVGQLKALSDHEHAEHEKE